MKSNLTRVLVAFACCIGQQALVDAVAQEKQAPTPEVTNSAKIGAADGTMSPALTGVRRPLYRLRRSDILEFDFTFSPEFNQTVSVQPDGFISLRGVPQVLAEGLTIPKLIDAVRELYAASLNDPEVAVQLKDFDKPYFTATGEVGHPGKYEIREDLTLHEALAIAGGLTSNAKHSQIILFRRVSDDMVESHVVDVKRMLNTRQLSEDIHLESGDFLYAPKNSISKIRQYLPASNLSLYSNPQF